MKKLMLGALAALCAMLALPAFASALPAHVSPAPDSFSVHGGNSSLTRTAGGNTTGTTTTGTGSFENTTTGTVNLTFHHVTTALLPGANCTSPGAPTAGTVETTELPFHLVMLETNKPGILITPNTTVVNGEPVVGTKHFATFNCSIFVKIVVKGNGILGTITSPECGGKSNTATLSFKSKEPGHQEHLTYTGTNYDLESSVNEGAYSTSAMDAHATITFGGGAMPELVCTH